MQRIVVVVIVLLVVWRILAGIGKRLAQRAPGADSFSRFSPQARRRRKRWAEDHGRRSDELVECAACGVFFPAREALTAGGDRVVCSEACRAKLAEASHRDGG